MKTLFLVGESLPTGTPVALEALGTMSDLDARHGVFPNLVMKPLLSTLWAFKDKGHDDGDLWSQINDLVGDKSTKRFNGFKKHSKEPPEHNNPDFEVLDDTVERLRAFDPNTDIWATFGFQTTFGLIRWMMKGERRVSKKQIKDFAKEFLSIALKRDTAGIFLLKRVPDNACARQGVIHRLCTYEDANGNGMEAMLQTAISKYTDEPKRISDRLRCMRSFVPLLHNEAYQLSPYGVGQANFVLADDYVVDGDVHPVEMYWRVMGNAIMRQLLRPSKPTEQ